MDRTPPELKGRSLTTGVTQPDGSTLLVVDHHEIVVLDRGQVTPLLRSEFRINAILPLGNGRLLIGTQNAHLFLFERGSLLPVSAFDSVPERPLFHVPWGELAHSPAPEYARFRSHGGQADTHSLRQGGDGTLYGCVHVGGAYRSVDGGARWSALADISGYANPDSSDPAKLNVDVHDLAVSDSNPKFLAFATRVGTYVSEDGGDHFELRNNGVPVSDNYQRSVAIIEHDGKRILLRSTCAGPGREQGKLSRIYRSEDAGVTWSPVIGLPANDAGHIDTIKPIGGSWVIALVGTEVFQSIDCGATWTSIPELRGTAYTDPLLHIVRPVIL
jgi:hypothetical protein